MDHGDDWRNKGKVQVISAIDTLIGIFFIIFYIYYGITFIGGFNELPAEELSIHLGRFLVFVLGVVVFSINGWQIYVAVTLFKLLRLEEEELNAQIVIRKCRLWFKTSLTIIFFIIIKFFFLTLVPLGSSNTFDFFLCLFEFVFRIFGLYFVKEFLDDLISEINRSGSSSKGLGRQASLRQSQRAAQSSSESEANKSNKITSIEMTDFVANTTTAATGETGSPKGNAIRITKTEPDMDHPDNKMVSVEINTHHVQQN